MTTYVGIAWALYGSRPSRITTTVLAGATKQDIRVSSSETREFVSPSRKIVGDIFGSVGDIVRKTMAQAEGLVPIITGVEEGYNTDDLFNVLTRDYGDVLVDLRELDPRAAVLSLRTMERAFRQHPDIGLRQQAFKYGLCAILKEAVGPESRGKVLFAPPRNYSCAEGRVREFQQNPRYKVTRGEDIIPADLKVTTEALLDRYEGGEESAREELWQCAEQLGACVAGIYSGAELANHLFGSQNALPDRFWSAPDELRSRVYVVPGARERYAATVMELMKIKQNICVKGTRDPRSPPFADVTACYMADEMDKKTGDKPSVVLVQHRL